MADFVPTPLPPELVVTPDPEPIPAKQIPQRLELKPLSWGREHDALNVQWLVKHLIPRVGHGELFGPPGSGKSFLALDLAFAVALAPEGGKGDWFGFKVNHAPVVYLNLEGSIWPRLEAYMREHGLEPEDVPDFYAIDAEPFDIRQDEDLGTLAERIPEGAFVVIDTLSMACAGAEQNSSQDMGKVIRRVTELARKVGGFVLIVAHTGKDEGRGVSGWNGIKGAADVQIQVYRDKEAGRRYWQTAKVKDAMDNLEADFDLKLVTLGFDEDGELAQSCVVKHLGDACEQGNQTATTPRQAGKQPKSEKAPSVTSSERLLLMAYQQTADMLHTPEVPEEEVRKAFHALSFADSEDERRAVNQRYRRGLEGLLGKGLLSLLEPSLLARSGAHS